jgi:hypothetical protein
MALDAAEPFIRPLGEHTTMKPKNNGTPVYTRQHKHGLTVAQQSAIDLLVAGRTDTEAADLLQLSRTTITKWRLYDPTFQAGLNQRRAEVWGAGVDRLRALVPKALDVLAHELEDCGSPNRLKAAAEVLRVAQLPPASSGIGPTNPEAIVKGVVQERRDQTPDMLTDLLQREKGLPPLAEHVEQVWCELENLANGENGADA